MADGCGQRFRILWFDHEAGFGFFDDLARLTIYSQDYRPGARHELEHLGRNHGFEDVSLFQKNKAGVGSRDEGGDVLAGLLVEKANVRQTAGLCEGFDAFFFRPLADEEKKHVGIQRL